MLREALHRTNHTFDRLTIMYAGQIGFRVPNDRLPWSALGGELEKQGYAIHNWPQGVFRKGDKGVYSLSAEEVDRLYHALFSDEQRLQFVCRHDGMFLRCTSFLSDVPAENGERIAPLLDVAASHEGNGSSMPAAGRQPRFRVTTQEMYNAERPHKRRRA